MSPRPQALLVFSFTREIETPLCLYLVIAILVRDKQARRSVYERFHRLEGKQTQRLMSSNVPPITLDPFLVVTAGVRESTVLSFAVKAGGHHCARSRSEGRWVMRLAARELARWRVLGSFSLSLFCLCVV